MSGVATLKLLVLGLALLPAAAASSPACECRDDPRPLEERLASIAEDSVLLTGTVVSVESDAHQNMTATLRDSKVWRGVDSPTVVLRSNPRRCGFAFERGARYLVVAEKDEGELYVSACSPTSPLRDAIAALHVLGSPQRRFEEVDVGTGDEGLGMFNRSEAEPRRSK